MATARPRAEGAFLLELEDERGEMPPLEVNVTLLVKMKNMSQPIELSRNYLPQFYCYKRVEMDQWVRNAVNGYHDYGYPVNSYTRQYQKDRIQKLFDTILKF